MWNNALIFSNKNHGLNHGLFVSNNIQYEIDFLYSKFDFNVKTALIFSNKNHGLQKNSLQKIFFL